VEISPSHIRRSLSFSLWRTKEVRRSGKHLEPQRTARLVALSTMPTVK
jgi:hypothetical protein